LVGTNHQQPPKDSEIEVSLFGPGYGEGILVHLGNGDWVVIDSCLDKNLRNPSIIQYLEQIGIDPCQAVKLIVITHWHDDHIRGIAKIFENCPAADLVCSAALNRSEFIKLVRLQESAMTRSPGLNEFSKLLEILISRKKGKRVQSKMPNFALAGMDLWKREGAIPARVHALSPSNGALGLAYHEISRLMQVKGQTKRAVVAQEPNNLAVALWIKIGEHSILLGSDLEETADPNTGWSIIVDSKIRPQEKAAVFKIPHHGSINGHQQKVWDDMLVTDCWAILSPFVHGGISLPEESDSNRICSLTDNAYITSLPRKKTIKFQNKMVEKTVKESVRNIRAIKGSEGQIRLRLEEPTSGHAEWKVELFGTSRSLKKLTESA